MSRPTAWVGWVWFAALLIMSSGVLNIMTGIVAVVGPDRAYLDTDVGLVGLNVEGWGWAHLVLGVLLVIVGVCLALGQTWARLLAIIVVTLNLLAQFVSLPAFPWWSAIVIVIDLLVLWAIIVHGDEAREV